MKLSPQSINVCTRKRKVTKSTHQILVLDGCADKTFRGSTQDKGWAHPINVSVNSSHSVHHHHQLRHNISYQGYFTFSYLTLPSYTIRLLCFKNTFLSNIFNYFLQTVCLSGWLDVLLSIVISGMTR